MVENNKYSKKMKKEIELKDTLRTVNPEQVGMEYKDKEEVMVGNPCMTSEKPLNNEEEEEKEILKMLEFEIEVENKKKKEGNIEKIKGNDVSVGVFQLLCTLSGKLEIVCMVLATIGSLGAGVSLPIFSILIGGTMSGYGSQQNITPGPASLLKVMGEVVRNFLIVGACMFVAYFLMNSLWSFVGSRQLHRLQEMYFSNILRQEQGFFDESNAFEFSTKVQAQLKTIEGGVGDKCGLLLMMLAQVFAGLIIAFTTSWALTLVMLSVSPLIILSVLWTIISMKKGIIEARMTYEKAGGIAEEVLYQVKTVASFANYAFEKERFHEQILDVQRIGFVNALKMGIGYSALFFFMYLSYCIAMIYGRVVILEKQWNNNQNRVFQGGDVMTVIFSTVMAVASLGGLAPCIKSISEACHASSDFFFLSQRQPKMDLSISTKVFPREELFGQIEMKDVSFSYPTQPDRKILNRLNILFPSGKKIALVGESGCGKSTIVNLIERLYEPTEGEIFVDGHNIKEFDIRFLRSLIGFVQQEPVLFNKSIKENVIFGRDLTHLGDADQLVREACESAYANSFINQIKEKYDYVVGIKGSKLSGGQKQRIAIARAILERPKILILDEATSALDNKCERQVQMALDRIIAEKKDMTTIIIAHRLSTVMNADLIYAIKDGIVLESGTHEQLWNLNGYYAQLVRSQMVISSTDVDDEKPDKNEAGPLPTIGAMDDERAKLNYKLDSKLPSSNLVEEQDFPSEEVKKEIKVDRNKLFQYLKSNKCGILSASIGSVCIGGSSPIFGLILSSCVNCLSDANPKVVSDDGLFYAMMFLLIAGVVSISYYFQNTNYTKIGEILAYKLRKAVFEHYMRLHLAFYDENQNAPGALLTKLSIDTTQLSGLILTVIGVSVQSMTTCIVGLILGFIFDWRLSLISLCFFPFIIMAAYLNQKFRKGLSNADEKLEIEAGSVLSECVINTKTIFSFNFQSKAIELYKDIILPAKERISKQSLIGGFLLGVGQFATFAAYATVFYASAQFIIQGDLNFNNMTRSILCILMSAYGIAAAQQYAGDYAKASNAFSSLFSTLNTLTEMDTSEEYNKSKLSAANIHGKIEFKNVTFAYPTRPKNKVLKNVTFTIEPGQAVAFVGFSGSGKSTIVQLIERFYDVKDGEGEILIDGVNIKDYNLIELRQKIGVVAQEPALFKRSIKDNILYGNLNATIPQIVEAAKKAKIQKLFKKKLSEMGHEKKLSKDSFVSGGEKQRLAIARAFLKNPKIMLLDEATSALDQAIEKEIQKEIYDLQGGRTSISIAHRLSTIQNSDHIYVLEAGRIVEDGTHQYLFDLKGKYHMLYTYSSQH